jgi:hypothetical protein
LEAVYRTKMVHRMFAAIATMRTICQGNAWPRGEYAMEVVIRVLKASKTDR